MRQRQCLRLVQNDHAAGDVVKLAATRWTICKQALEELHRCRHNDWSVPILRCQPQLGTPGALSRLTVTTVMLHNMIRVWPECRPEHLGGLLDDAGVRDHVDHPVQLMRESVIKCKSQRRERLAAARRHGQRKHARRLFCLYASMLEDARSETIKGGRLGALHLARHVPGELIPQHIQPLPSAALGLPALGLRIETLGIDVVRVNQRREDHPPQVC